MSITLRQPSFNGLLIISRLVVEMGLSPDEFKDLTTAECYKLIDRHGEKVAQIIAVSVLRWPPLIWGYKRFARWMGWRIEPALLAYALHLVLTLNDAGGFHKFYQIGNGAASEPSESEESGEHRGRVVGLHSPWGMLYQLRKDLHLSRWEVAWGESWINIAMMLDDAPHYVSRSDHARPAEEMSDDDLKKFANELN